MDETKTKKNVSGLTQKRHAKHRQAKKSKQHSSSKAKQATRMDGGGGRGHPYKFNGGTPIAKKFDLCVLLALLLFEFG